MNTKEKINKTIKEALLAEGVEIPVYSIEHPSDIDHGDYATNVAMVAAKQAGKNPRELAQKLVNYLQEHKPEEVEKVEPAGPGFVNFYLSKDFFVSGVKEILDNPETFGKSEQLKGEKVMVEYTDPNAFKALHIGHLMANTLGESLSRLVEFNGAEVIRACYASDIGLNTAKAVWGMKQMLDDMPSDDETLTSKTQFLQSAYVHGNTRYEEDEKDKEAIDGVNKALFEKSDEEMHDLYLKGRRWSFEHFEEIYKVLGTSFKQYFYESETFQTGMAMVFEAAVKGIFEKSDGAIVYRGENRDNSLHTRVFVNSQGLPTYEAKELGLNKEKFNRIPDISRSIIITAVEQSSYFKVVLSALAELLPDIADKTDHISHGMMRFASGKMSSRKGNIVTAEDLLNNTKTQVLERMKDRDFDEGKKAELSEDIAVSAIKYSVLKQTPGKNITFDVNQALSFEGDSGPYLQYSYVRAKSVLEKARAGGMESSYPSKEVIDGGWETTHLERMLYRFPEIVESAYRDDSVTSITVYLTELASIFNTYYAHERIVDAEDDTSCYKIALTEAFANVMKNGLYILAIEAPDEM